MSSSSINPLRGWRKVLSIFAAFAVAVALLPTQPAAAGPNDVSGTVFRDQNFDGTFDAGEPGEGGIIVTAIDAAGLTASTTSLGDGTYVLDTSALADPVTITFEIPAAKQGYLKPGPIGVDNRSDVVVASQSDTGVDFGVINPSHYCQDNPFVITNCYIEGDQSGGGDVLVQTEFLAQGDGFGGTGTLETQISDATIIGTTYGLAIQTFNDHDPSNDVIFAGAFLKRFAGYGPGGADTIYRLDRNGNELNRINIEAGNHVHDFSIIPGGFFGPEIVDAATFERVGKEGFGDLDLSEDQTKLYAVNLFTRELHQVDVDPTSATFGTVLNNYQLASLPGHACGGTIRPGAVGVEDGRVYVGTVCDDASNAWVHSMDPATGTFALELTIPLGYAREFVGANRGYTAEWNPWQDTFVGNPTGWGFPEVANQQPWLLDIDFDNDGMVIGFRDRYGDQTGSQAPQPNFPADDNLYSTDSAGEILRACKLADGTFALENTAFCPVGNGGNFGSGPGGGQEWFDGDYYLTGTLLGHEEISHGGLAVHNQRNEVLMTAYDALDDTVGEYAFSQGLARLDITSGDKVGQYRVVGDIFGKAGGLGDLEAFCDGAPLEIGNYVWLDLDVDGIQDPDEPPLQGVLVTHVETGATVTTGADGYYVFPVTAGADYTLTFDASGAVGVDPSILQLTPADQGASDELDSDAAQIGGGLPTITGTAGLGGENDHSMDVGFYEKELRIGNLVWHDANDNAAVDAGEAGIGGVTVELYAETGTVAGFDATDTLVDTTTTDATGNYWFEEAQQGVTYYVALPDQSANTLTAGGLPFDADGLRSSTGGNLAENDVDNVDDGDPSGAFLSVSGPIGVVEFGEPQAEADANTTTDAEAYVEGQGARDLADNDSNLTVDLGIVSGNRIGNLVWVDGVFGEATYNDGVADAGEAPGGIGGVTVELYVDSTTAGTPGQYDAGVDALVDTTTTDANGNYWFAGMPDGTYFAAIPAGQTGQTVDGATVDLSDLVSSTPTPSDADLGLDDLDDADPASGFAAISGPFSVDAGANPTDEAGDFNDATPGAAEVVANADASNTVLPDVASDLTIDFGFVEPPRYSLGNLVWLDIDDDGLAESGEPGIAGVSVELYDVDGDLVDTVVTDTDGKYEFTDLPAGDYTVVIPDGQTGQTISGQTVDLDALLPSSNTVADPDAPADADNDNNGVDGPAGLTSGVVSIGNPDQFVPNEPTDEQLRSDDPTDDDTDADAQGNLTVDFGYVEPLRVGNLVWLDDGGTAGAGGYVSTNEDDAQADAGEIGIEGVLVQLLDVNDVVIAETVTDANGNYWFDGLYAGDYSIGIPTNQSPLLGALVGIDPLALDGLRSSQGQSSTGETADDDDDGAANGGFASLSAQFTLDERTEADDELGDFADATIDGAETAANAATPFHFDASSNLEIDFGFAEISDYRLGNLVWEDHDLDGIADAGEPGVAGVLVQLLDDAGEVIAETVTDAAGKYLFNDLPAGDYQVRIPADQTPTLGAQPGLVPGLFDDYSGVPNPVADPDPIGVGDTDNDNNGVVDTGLTSGPVTLGEGTENDEPQNEINRSDDPTLDEDGAHRDDRSNLTVDFALQRLYQVGNLVWEDYDNDGIAEDGEPGIEGLLVQLLDSNGDVIAETVTDADGHYLFTGLEADDYRVFLPGDQTPVLGAQPDLVPDALDELETSGTPTFDPDPPTGDVDNDNNGVENAGYLSGVFSLGEGTGEAEPVGETLRDDDATLDETANLPDARSNLSVDFGFFRGVRIGNQVWKDGNQGEANYNNGVFDAGETPIVGVSVELWEDDGSADFDPLLDTLIATTVTDGEGNYWFDDVDDDGTYFVAIPTIPAADPSQLSSVGQSADPVAVDNDDDGAPSAGYSSVSNLVTVTAGLATEAEVDANPAADDTEPEANTAGTFYPDDNSELTVDFGFVDVPIYRIGNLVWEDVDNDGVAEAGEPGIAGVLVQLLDDSGAVIAETATDADGHYAFENLIAGDYTVRIPTDQAPVFAAPADFDPAALDGFQSSTNGEEANANDDADNNDNGLGLSDWANTVTVGETLSLDPGDEPQNETLRADDASDDDPNLGEPGFYPDGLSNLSVDFGFFKLALGNQVWFDANDNGVIDVTEDGIQGVVVELVDVDSGDVVDTAVTDADGLYLFERLLPGVEYIVQIPASEFGDGEPLEGLFSSTDPVAGAVDADGDESTPNDGIDSDDNGSDPVDRGDAVVSLPVVLEIGDEPLTENPDNGVNATDANENLTVDFGFHNGGRIGSLVWIDDESATAADENGVADLSESGVDDVTVELYLDDGTDPGGFDADDTLVASTTTAAGGVYEFGNLDEGSYLVVIPEAELGDAGPLAGYEPTYTTSATDTNNDSDGTYVDGVGVVAPLVELTFGAAPTGEPAHGTSLVADEDTTYADDNSNLTIDFGFIEEPTYRIGNLVWEDLDADGIAEDGEGGIAGVLVQLLDEGGEVVAETITDADGKYVFDELTAGDYQVRIPSDQEPELLTTPDPTADIEGFRSSDIDEANADGDVDNDDNGLGLSNWTSGVVTLGEDNLNGEPEDETLRDDLATDDDPNAGDPAAHPDGRSNLSVDFGFYELTLGNTVWFDANNSGDIDNAEEGIEGVVVELLDADGTVVDTETTDADGNYLFTELEHGETYVVAVAASNFADGAVLEGYTSSTGAAVGGDPDFDTTDEDDNGAPVAGAVQSDPVTVLAGSEPTAETGVDNDPNTPDNSENLTVDFGFFTLSLGNQVWYDVDDNGVIDATEDGIEGVVVELVDAASGEVIATTTTDADGLYVFERLLPDVDYIVQIPASEFGDGEPLEGLFSSTDPVAGTVDADGDESVANDGVDSDDNGADAAQGATVQSLPITLMISDEPLAEDPDSLTLAIDENENLTVDFGFHEGGRIGSLVWIDDLNATADDENGTAELSEAGVEDVSVELYLDDGATAGVVDADDTLVATTVTDADGVYEFGNLAEGDYLVVIPEDQLAVGEALDGFVPTFEAAVDGTNNDSDGTLVAATGVVAAVTLTYGDAPTAEPAHGTDGVADEDDLYADDNSDLTIDFGFVEDPTYRIGNLVFEDLDADGIAEDGEPGIAGVLVQLLDDAGDVVAETVTDADGTYVFDELTAGDYQVRIPSDQEPELLTTPDPTAGALDDMRSSDVDEANADGDVDNDDNGLGEYDWTSGVVALGEGNLNGEPEDETVRADVVTDDDPNDGDPTAYPDGRSNLSVDFGFYELSLGNTVWFDWNNSGDIDDASEIGAQGVTVNLLDEDGNLLDSTVTDADGNYLFTELTHGETYIVEIDDANFADGAVLDGYTSSTGAAVGNDPDSDTTDEDDNGAPVGAAVQSDPVTLFAGDEPTAEPGADNDPNTPDASENLTVDFGFFTLALGNQVWLDTNDNGVIDAGEDGIEGVVVELVDAATGNVIATTTTDAAGLYVFDELLPDVDYIVQIPASEFAAGEPLEGLFSSTDPVAGTVDADGVESVLNDGVDSDDNGADAAQGDTVATLPVTLMIGDEPLAEDPGSVTLAVDENENLTIDFGFHEGGQIGSLVFIDDGSASAADENGVADAGEPGVEGVTVELYLDDGTIPGAIDEDDTLVETTTTDPAGEYLFGGLDQGDYLVVIPEDQLADGAPLADYVPTYPTSADDVNNDSDGSTVVGVGVVSSLIELTFGGEPTDDVTHGTDGSAEDDNFADDNSNLTVDFGFVEDPTYRIGNLVFEDLDADGIAEDGEPGIAGVLVQLLDDAGDVVAETITGADGKYVFDELEAGDYQVRIPSDQTPELADTAAPIAGVIDDMRSSDVDEANADGDVDNDDNGLGLSDWTSGVVTLGEGNLNGEPEDETVRADVVTDDDPNAGDPTAYPDGRSNLSVDFGFYELSLGNSVFADWNNSGDIDDPSETGIEGVTVNLLDEDGNVVESTVTDADGNYLFAELTHGETYIVEIDDANFADGAVLDGFTSSTGPAAGGDPDFDETDEDDNGQVQDGSVQSFPVTLFAGGEPTAEPGADNDPDTPDAGENLTVDFGFFTLALGNQVWLDTDDDGVIDADEPGIEGVVVELVDAATGDVIDSTITDADGMYSFERLEPDVEYIVQIPPSEFATGEPLEGLFSSTDPASGPIDADGDESVANDGVDSDDNGADAAQGDTIATLPVVLMIDDEPLAEDPDSETLAVDDNENLTIDFGFHQGGQIGSLVFIDDGSASAADENGVADAGEPGVAGVTVELYLDDGAIPGTVDADDALIATTTTAADGTYSFDGLDQGDYLVVIPEDQLADGAPLADHVPTYPTTADDTNNDSDGWTVDGVGIVSPVIELTFGGEPTAEPANGTDGSADEDPVFADDNSNLTVDFGFVEYPTYRIGNLVFEDLDADGIAELGEPGIEGVLVQLLDENAEVVAEAITDADGTYVFDELEAGDYQVRIPSDQTPELADTAAPIAGVIDDMRSSDVDEANADGDVDNDDNGLGLSDWTSGAVTLGEGNLNGEPEDEAARAGLGLDDDPNAGDPAAYPDGRSNLSVDFGFYELSLGNSVFADWNNSGDIDDPSETGIEGVTVNLLDEDGNVVESTVTDADGNYLFTELTHGETYIVEIDESNFADGAVLEDWYSADGPNVGADPDGDPTDEDDNGTLQGSSVVSEPITLFAGGEPTDEPGADNDSNTPDAGENLTVDFGFYTLAIGNLVWLDIDDNGVVGVDEPGIPGVTVELVDPTSGEIIDTVVTDGNGQYLFTGLPEGDYLVQIPADNFAEGGPLEGLASSPPDVVDPDDEPGDDDDNGSNGAIAASGIFTLAAGEVPEATGDTANAAPELPLASQNLNVDFGFHGLALGDLVFLDMDGDGIFDPVVDEGRAGVIVELWEVDPTTGEVIGTTPLATELTDETGHYLFTGLEPGTYAVAIPSENLEPAGSLFGFISTIGNGLTAPDPDDDGNSDDNGDPTPEGDTWSAPIELTPASEPTDEGDAGAGDTNTDDTNANLTVDFGFEPRVGLSLGNQIWHDLDGDGIVDPDEAGIDGVTVELYDADGNLLATEITSDGGFYQFVGLDEGDYTVVVPSANFDEPTDALWGLSSSADPADGPVDPDDDVDNQDNGADPAEPFGDVVSEPVTLIDLFEPLGEEPVESPGTQIPSDPMSNLTVDFGFVSVALGGTLFADPGEDGSHDAADGVFAGVPVELLDADGQPVLDGAGDPITTVTDADGNYVFEGLVPGAYRVAIPEEAFAAGGPLELHYSTRGNDTDGASPDPDNDIDAEDNGDTDGPDVFCGCPVISAPVDLFPATEPTGEAGPASEVPDHSTNLTVDLGFVPTPPLELGGVVWIDPDNGGSFGTDEVPAPAGVELQLFDAFGQPIIGPDGLPMTTTTAADGSYSFTGLVPGDYVVVIPATNVESGGPLEGLWPSTGEDVSADPNDDDANVSDGQSNDPADRSIKSGVVTLYPESEPIDDPAPVGTDGENSNQTVDFGVYEVEVDGTLFIDSDNDGEQGPGEEPLIGVVLVLVTPDGEPVLDADGVPMSAESDEDGGFSFDGLPEGEYVVVLTPENFEPGGPLQHHTPSKAPDNDDFAESGGFESVGLEVSGGDDEFPSFDLGFRAPAPIVDGVPSEGEAEGATAGDVPAAETPEGPLAFTGGEVKTPVALGAGLILVGMLAVGVGRRREDES